MKKLITILTAFLFSGLLSAQTVLFDFGRHDGGTNGDVVSNPSQPDGSTNVYWNSLGQSTQDQVGGSAPANPIYTTFVDINNNSLSGWTISNLNSNSLDGNGYNNGGLSTDASTEDPVFANLGNFAVKEATGDYWFTGSGSVGFTLSGLDTGKQYSFEFFGSRVGTSDRRTTYTAQGNEAAIDSLALRTTGTSIGTGGYNGNNDTTVSILNITPDASGEIDISFVNSTGDFGYLNAMQVTVIPEPASLLLFGLAGLSALLLRLRR